MPAEDDSTRESRAKPTSVTDPATTPAAMPTTASMRFQDELEVLQQ
jgi:hypothetical protein